MTCQLFDRVTNTKFILRPLRFIIICFLKHIYYYNIYLIPNSLHSLSLSALKVFYIFVFCALIEINIFSVLIEINIFSVFVDRWKGKGERDATRGADQRARQWNRPRDQGAWGPTETARDGDATPTATTTRTPQPSTATQAPPYVEITASGKAVTGNPATWNAESSRTVSTSVAFFVVVFFGNKGLVFGWSMIGWSVIGWSMIGWSVIGWSMIRWSMIWWSVIGWSVIPWSWKVNLLESINTDTTSWHFSASDVWRRAKMN